MAYTAPGPYLAGFGLFYAIERIRELGTDTLRSRCVLRGAHTLQRAHMRPVLRRRRRGARRCRYTLRGRRHRGEQLLREITLSSSFQQRSADLPVHTHLLARIRHIRTHTTHIYGRNEQSLGARTPMSQATP